MRDPLIPICLRLLAVVEDYRAVLVDSLENGGFDANVRDEIAEYDALIADARAALLAADQAPASGWTFNPEFSAWLAEEIARQGPGAIIAVPDRFLPIERVKL